MRERPKAHVRSTIAQILKRAAAPALVASGLLASAAPSCEQPVESSEPEVIFCKVEPGACSQRIIELIDSAEKTLQCAIYSFTLDEVAHALAAAVERGVEVWVVVEATQLESDVADILEASGAYFRLDGNSRSMHHKFVVVDERVVGTGSFNWTLFANTQNDENLMVFGSKELADQFGEEFVRVWTEAAE